MEEFELETGEVIVAQVRQHLFVLALKLLPLLVLAYAPGILGGIFSVFSSANPAASAAFTTLTLPPDAMRFVTGVWLLILWTAAFSIVTRYFLTVWVITNLRIVDIKQYGFFNREVSSFLLIRVQDITTQTSGFLATLIGFGRLSVETAGNDEHFEMRGISRPESIRDLIMRQVALLHDDVTPLSGL